MNLSYLVRYGIMSHVARFAPERDGDLYDRGQSVLVRTERGLELGEILGAPKPAPDADSPYAILRPTTDHDRQFLSASNHSRAELLSICDTVFQEGTWPLDLIDVEILPPFGSEETQAILHYLGPHGLDTEGLSEALKERTGLTLRFQPAGLDADPLEVPDEEPDVCSRCGSSGGGGCGSSTGDSHSGCSSCALSALPRRKAGLANASPQ